VVIAKQQGSAKQVLILELRFSSKELWVTNIANLAGVSTS